MSKKILLIESDASTAAELARALEARGVETRVTGDGKEGLELARDEQPDAIVLCVELPKMSGYSVCQKLRKDEGLKSIPLVLTSAEATEETFEAHRKLKARADAYLLKPFAPGALIEALEPLVELPGAPAGGDDELVTLDDVEELSGEIPLIPAGEKVRPADALPDQDEDLKLLDDAFDSISGDTAAARPAAPAGGGALPDEQPLSHDELRQVADLLPAGDEAAGPADIDRLGAEADAALAALGTEEPAPAGSPVPEPALEEPVLDEPAAAPPRAASAEALRAAGIPLLSAQPAAPAGPPGAALLAEREAEIRRLEERVAQLHIDMGRAREGAAAEARGQADRAAADARALAEKDVAAARAEARREADARRQAEDRARRAEDAQRRAEEAREQAEEALRAAEEAVRKGEGEVQAIGEALHAAEEAQRAAEEQGRAAGERAGMLEAELASLRQRVEEAEQTSSLKVAQLAEAQARHGTLGDEISALTSQLAEAHGFRGEAESLRADLEAARGAAEAQRAEAERRAGDVARRLSELEAVNAKHEERVVKAYQKIKADEKIREKTRKALAIALQLLDERLAAPPAKEPGEPAPRRE